MTAGTWFDNDDYWNGIYTNECGMKAGHAYTLISAFELYEHVTEPLTACMNLDYVDESNFVLDLID